MIVHKIDVEGVAVLETEDDPPVGTDRDGPMSIQVTLEGMQVKRVNVQVLRPFGRVECGEDEADSGGIAGGNLSGVILLIEPLQSSMPKTSNHCIISKL